MGDRRRGAAAAAAAVLLAALTVLVVGQVALPAGTTALGPGRAEASCAPALVYDGVFWQSVQPIAPVVLGDPVEGALYPPCDDTINSDAREAPVDAFRVVGLPSDYLATGTGEGQLFRRTTTAYNPVLDARGVVDAIGIGLVLLVLVLVGTWAVRAVVRRRREAQLPPVTGA